MIVTLDGRRVACPDSTDSLERVIDAVAREHLSGRLVVSVSVNGHPLLDEALQQGLTRPLDDSDQLDLETADPLELAQQALHDVAAQLAAAADMNRDVAEQLRRGEIASAGDYLTACTRVWVDCHQVLIEASKLLGRDLAFLQFDGAPLGERLGDISAKLRDLRDLLDARDWVSVADVLEYEMPELCEEWQGRLEQIADGLSQGS